MNKNADFSKLSEEQKSLVMRFQNLVLQAGKVAEDACDGSVLNDLEAFWITQGRNVLNEALQASVAEAVEKEQEKEAVCPKCGQAKMHSRGNKKKDS